MWREDTYCGNVLYYSILQLGDEAVQHREVEGCESDDFKEYFKKMGVKFETIEGG